MMKLNSRLYAIHGIQSEEVMKLVRTLLAGALFATALSASASPALAREGQWVWVCTYDRETYELKICEWVWEE